MTVNIYISVVVVGKTLIFNQIVKNTLNTRCRVNQDEKYSSISFYHTLNNCSSSNDHSNNYILIFYVILVFFSFFQCSPTAYVSDRRAFLRCHFSPIACKRNTAALEENQNLLPSINKNDLETCINENKPVWFCLNNALQFTLQNMDSNDQTNL